ncbi:MAG: hypothetical protein NTZ02_02755 [Candidatus Woesearchaeota archaeon]|nr:hypothetical protein [Candidatus Woesearchaeota archaeon]
MSSGKSVYDRILKKINEVEDHYEALSRKLYSNENSIESFSKERNNSYIELAKFYLPQMNAETVANTLPEFQGLVQKVFNDKQQRRKKVESLSSDSRKDKAALEKKFAETDETLEEKVKEINELRGVISDELKADKGYTELKDNANKADEVLAQNKKRYEAFKIDAEKKLADYESSQFFMYLLKREYDPKHNSLMDRFVAKVINYEENKKNYDFLTSMPEAIETEIKKRQEDLDALVAQISDVEKDKAKKHGLDSAIAQGRILGEKRKSTMSEIEKSDSDYKKYIQEIKGIDDDKGPYYREVIANLENYLGRKDLSFLKNIASSTSRKEDDELVAKIENADKKIAELKQEAKSLKTEQSSIGAKLDGLREFKRDYTRNDYESSESRFRGDFDIDRLLQLYMLRSLTINQIFTEMKEHQYFERHSYESDSWYHGSSGSSGSGGGFGSGGSFGTGGSFGGGGGFGTGGGFGH